MKLNKSVLSFVTALFLTNLGFLNQALAESKVWTLSAEDKIVVKALLADIEIVAKESSKKTQVSWSLVGSESWALNPVYIDKQLKIEVTGPTSKVDWIRQSGSKGLWPRLKLKIIGPSRDLKVSLVDGKVELKGWQNAAALVQQTGKLKTFATKGELSLSLQEGQLSAQNHTGGLKVESYSSRLELSKVKGGVEVNNYNGSTKLTGIEGSLRLTSFKGKAQVRSVEGSFEFKNTHAQINVTKMDGSLQGKTVTGPVNIRTDAEARIRVDSGEAPVSIRVARSAAYVNLGTQKGGIEAPSYLKRERWSNLRTVTGSLRGSSPGRIRVRTETGRIALRTGS